MRIEPAGFTRAVAFATVSFDAPEDHRKPLPAKVSDEQCSTSSCSTSSIGRNSDVSSERSMAEEDDSAENEAQSAYNGPLHAMKPLEEVLPIRRGISKFYNGKSKSFTSLCDAPSSPSVKDIAKPENAYTRRRRNLMAFNHVWDKNRNFPLRSNSGGISKRPISSSRSSLALAVAMSNSDSNSSCSSTSEDSTSSSNSRSFPLLSPLHPRNRVSIASAAPSPSSPLQKNFSAWHSFSLADLQHCAIAATATIKMSSSSLGNDTAHRS